jgi:hypothetical protein
MTGGNATKVLAVLDYTDASAGNTVRLGIMWFSIAGTYLSLDWLVSKTGANDGIISAEVLHVAPANAAFARLIINQVHSSIGVEDTIVYFAGVGCWNANVAASFQPTRFPVHPGTTGRTAQLDRGLVRSENGRTRVIDRTRSARPNVVTLAFTTMPQSDAVLFQKLDQLNCGRNWDVNVASTANPAGGSWPILLLPGNTGLVNAMVCDMTSGCNLEPDAEWGRQDPPYWQGSFEFTERS